MARQTSAPIVLSLIICDYVHADPGTGKKTLLGTFSMIGAPSFPVVHPELHVFAELTNGHGDTQVRLRLVRVTPDSIDGEEILSGTIDITFADPRQAVGFGIGFKNIRFPQAGEYRFILECGGALLLERPFLVAQIQQTPPPAHEPTDVPADA